MVSPQAVQQWAKGKSLPRGQGLKRLLRQQVKQNTGFHVTRFSSAG
ncbi:hypothetical protein O5268_12520 [Escherichia coli]|nr:hypothetical protein [Escherichia coli]